MRARTTELIRIWTEALVPVCNHSKSHASQELKWLLQHAKEQQHLNLKDHHNQLTGGGGGGGGQSVDSSKTGMNHNKARGQQLSEEEVMLMQSYVDQRVKTRKPLQYILGTQPFMDLEILTRSPTLIPRWETEEWTARLASTLNSAPELFRTSSSSPSSLSSPSPKFNILDLCTGSGCIPLGLASALPPRSCNLFGVDIHSKAVELATENEIKNRALLKDNRVQFRQADLLTPDAVHTFLGWVPETRPPPPQQLHHKLKQEQEQEQDLLVNSSTSAAAAAAAAPSHFLIPQETKTTTTTTTTTPRSGHYDLIISNPPYIAHSEYDTLEPEVAQWEDPKALVADQEGLVFYPRIAHMAMELLHLPHHHPSYQDHQQQQREWRNGPELDKVKIPELVFEIGGDHQVDFVRDAVKAAGFRRVEVWKDLADRARCIVGAR
ncbi:S-adenosyl-L-methionine-dependent methyltransferase [Dissophora ornata]|nr:S-adenosyl-L-methionine-dependent methyltransferase [Dissophora ornata]